MYKNVGLTGLPRGDWRKRGRAASAKMDSDGFSLTDNTAEPGSAGPRAVATQAPAAQTGGGQAATDRPEAAETRYGARCSLAMVLLYIECQAKSTGNSF